MGNSMHCLLRTIGQEIWELQITSQTDGDTILDYPFDTKKRHRIYGTFQLATKELFELIGTSIQGDAIVFTTEQLDLTSQIEYNDVIYEIADEIEQNYYLMPQAWTYIIRRKGARIPSA